MLALVFRAVLITSTHTGKSDSFRAEKVQGQPVSTEYDLA